jgi:restriction system protein
MVRKSKTSIADDIFELVALMPWWAGCALALVSYLLLHRVAIQPVTVVSDAGQISGMATQALWQGLATAGQYILPILCLGGAVASFFSRRKRLNLLAGAANSRATDALDGMSWQEFEMLVGEAFRQNGYQVVENGGGGADGGVDLVLRKDGEKFLVQCKQWKAYSVGVAIIRELYGVMAAKGATGGFVVTSGRFTEEAKAFASGRNVKLMDGSELRQLIQQTKKTVKSNVNSAVVQAAALACPLCTKPMVRRTAKRGSNIGNSFWGCSDYPACKGTAPL